MLGRKSNPLLFSPSTFQPPEVRPVEPGEGGLAGLTKGPLRARDPQRDWVFYNPRSEVDLAQGKSKCMDFQSSKEDCVFLFVCFIVVCLYIKGVEKQTDRQIDKPKLK